MLSLQIALGADCVQVTAVDPEGAPAAAATAPYPTLTPQPGWSEQNPIDWWEATVKAVQAVIKELGTARTKTIKSVSLTSLQGTAFLDEAYQPVRPAILGSDQRAVAEAAELGAPGAAGAMAAQVLWLRRHEPEAFARVQLLVQPKEYIRFRMTGMLATDRTGAPATLLYDEGAQTWSQERCEALGIALKWLPPLKEPTEVVGQIIPGIWALTGIPAWTPVTVG